MNIDILLAPKNVSVLETFFKHPLMSSLDQQDLCHTFFYLTRLLNKIQFSYSDLFLAVDFFFNPILLGQTSFSKP